MERLPTNLGSRLSGIAASARRQFVRSRFTLLAMAAVVLPITVSIIVTSYCVAAFDIGGTVYSIIKGICFFAVLLVELLVCGLFQRWRLSRKER